MRTFYICYADLDYNHCDAAVLENLDDVQLLDAQWELDQRGGSWFEVTELKHIERIPNSIVRGLYQLATDNPEEEATIETMRTMVYARMLHLANMFIEGENIMSTKVKKAGAKPKKTGAKRGRPPTKGKATPKETVKKTPAAKAPKAKAEKKQTQASVIRQGIKDGVGNDTILKRLKEAFPDTKAGIGEVNFYVKKFKEAA